MLDDSKSVLIERPEVIETKEAKVESKDEGFIPKTHPEGRYLYCVADSGERADLGKLGLDGKEVYTIPCVDLCAVVHNCPSEPYKSEDNEKVKRWVMAHEKVVEVAWERFGTILPVSFDTIIKGEKDRGVEENVKNWLKEDYAHLKQKMDKMRGKAEYGVQIFWDPKFIADEIAKTNEEIKNLNHEIKSKSKGMAYMLKQKLENLLKKEMEKKADSCFKEMYTKIKMCVDETKVEKTKRIDDKSQMLMNLSCLLDKEKYKELGEELEEINKQEGFTVHFTGPWPPYSFVALG
jgi:uncharacterized protein YajQ (UPF0234 family)